MSADPQSHPWLSAILVAHNSREDLERNLAGLVSVAGCQVILVDNGSSDGGPEYVRAEHPTVEVIVAENLGYGGGCNLGAERAQSNVLLFLNPDISIDEPSLQVLASTVLRDRGVAGPVILDHGSGERQYGARLDLMGMPEESLKPVIPLYVQGCALAIDAALFERIRGFESRYFLFAEDAEICWRAAGAGASVVVTPDALALHGGGHSIPGGYVKDGHRQIADLRFSLRERNTLAMFWSNAPLLFLLPFTALYLLKLAAFSLWAFATGRGELARALADGLRWNIQQLPETSARRRSRPGKTSWGWLLERIELRPAIITHVLRHGWPSFVGTAGTN